jgi:hypothetical protein
MSAEHECVLCHRTAPDVHMALLRFEASGQFYFGTDPRCTDHLACQGRVEAKGEEWPLAGFRRQKSVPA